MAALTAARSTDQYGAVGDNIVPNRYYFNVAAGVNIQQGSLVALDAAGNANPAGAGATLPKVMGRADEPAYNSGGSAGAIGCTVRQGCFLWDVSGALTNASIGTKVYAVDDHTVILANTSPNTACAGLFMGYQDGNNPTQACVLTLGAGSFGNIT